MSNSTLSLLNSTRCHPLLLNMSVDYPSIFRDPPLQSSLAYGLCPDTYFPLVISSNTLFFYLLSFTVGLVGLLWHRSQPHIQARGLYLILANMFTNLVIVFLITMRVIVGKRAWPCFLLSLTFMLYAPLFTLPSILRGCRIFFLYRLNLKKKKLFGTALQEDHFQNSGASSSYGNSQPPRKSSSALSTPMTPLSNRLSVISVSNSAMSSSENSSSTDSFNAFIPSTTTITTTNEKTEPQQSTSDVIISKQDRNIMKVYEFLASNRFFIIVYAIAMIVHILLYVILGGIELGVYRSSSIWLFVESGYFEAAHGCGLNPRNLIVLGVQAAIYIFTFLVINFLCMISDRDTFNIKLEELILTVCLTVVVISYCILGSIPEVTSLVDFFVPYAHVFLIYSYLELFIGVILPVCYSIRDLKKHSTGINTNQGDQHNVIENLLKDKKALEIVSEFARRSYCLEDVLAWKEIQKFKKLKKRKKGALDFIKTFLISGSPLELNIPNGTKILKNLQEQLDQCGEEPPVTLFDELEFQCLFNMVDILQRLRLRNEYIAKKLEE